MERIPEHSFLKYNVDTLSYMRKTYNLDKPGQMDEAIDLLDGWLKKQNHLVKKDFSREYLERIIILLKGSVERAKFQIENVCTVRTLLPQFFEKLDAKNDFSDINTYGHTTILPRLTKDHQRIYMVSFESAKYSPKIFLMMYYYNIIVCEYLKAHDYNDGMYAVIDFRKISSLIELVPQFNLFEMKQMATITLKAYAVRVKKFILISESNAIDLMVKIIRQMLPEKLRQRIFVAQNLEDLYKHVPKELLPSDYGGNEDCLSTLADQFQEAMATKENIEYLKEMSKARTNESLRTSTKVSDDLLGIEGSFRRLDFD